jgi:hypothetical protein
LKIENRKKFSFHTLSQKKKVIGICNGNLWFHIDGESGATYWDTISSYEDLLRHGIWLINEDDSGSSSDEESEEEQCTSLCEESSSVGDHQKVRKENAFFSNSSAFHN